jgi:hypothetical protein
VSLGLSVVFLLAVAFYCWRAIYAAPLALHGFAGSPYNQLADAFLHMHLWVARVPAQLLGPEPLNPRLRPAVLYPYADYALYGRDLYLTWGPAPVLVLLVPLHLLGFEPSASVIITPFAIVGLGFALASLRVIIRQVGDLPQWICVLAALTIAFASVVPFILRFPLVYHEAIAGAYCFAMAGVWLALTAIVARGASWWRLVLMSLCFGLAAGSRPTVGLAVLLLVPVYLSLRSIQPRRGLLLALALPVGICLLLLAAYNQARFGNPMELGTQYQINGGYHAHWGQISYVPIGLWSYLITPPRLGVLFPFLSIIYPQVSYPLGLPAHYAPVSEDTGGLLAMTPIVVFLVALPWIWRRRPQLLGPLSLMLVVMAGTGVLILLFLSYEFFGTTERYEVDYTTLLLFGALAVWLALSAKATGRRRRLIRIGGGLLAAWSCLTGVAIAYQEIDKAHPHAWSALVDIGSPLSTTIAALAGHPVLAEVDAAHELPGTPSYTGIGSETTGFWLRPGEHAEVTIVSPDSREAALAGEVFAGPALRAGAPIAALIGGPGSRSYQLPLSSNALRVPVALRRGINRLSLGVVAHSENPIEPGEPEYESQAVMVVEHLHVAGS